MLWASFSRPWAVAVASGESLRAPAAHAEHTGNVGVALQILGYGAHALPMVAGGFAILQQGKGVIDLIQMFRVRVPKGQPPPCPVRIR